MSARARSVVYTAYACASFCVCVALAVACSKPEQQRQNAEYGDAVGIEFGDAKTGQFLAAVAAEKGHSPEKGVPALATALHEAARRCPTLAKEALDVKSPPTLHFVVKNGVLQAVKDPHPEVASECLATAMDGKAANLESATPFDLTIQLMVKKAPAE